MTTEYQPWTYAGKYSARIGNNVFPFEIYAGRGKIGIAPVKDEVVIETHLGLKRDSINPDALFEVLARVVRNHLGIPIEPKVLKNNNENLVEILQNDLAPPLKVH